VRFTLIQLQTSHCDRGRDGSDTKTWRLGNHSWKVGDLKSSRIHLQDIALGHCYDICQGQGGYYLRAENNMETTGYLNYFTIVNSW